MGANLCCFKCARSEHAAEVPASNHRGRSQGNNGVYKVDRITLKEFLLASPASGKVHAFQSSPEASGFHTPRASLSSPDQHVTNLGYFSPRLSFSSERLGKIEEELSPSRSAMMNRSLSGGGTYAFKKHKKVTFKLPEKADVMVFCSPQGSFQDK